MASGPSLARKLREDGLDVTSSLDIVTLIKAGNLEAIQAVRQAGRDLGDVLASSVSLINPAVIVIGGSLSAAGGHLITGVKEVVYARAMPLATAKLNIVQADQLAGAGVIGAGVLAIGHVLGEDA